MMSDTIGSLNSIAEGDFSCTLHMGGCQNYGPFLDPHYNAAPNI